MSQAEHSIPPARDPRKVPVRFSHLKRIAQSPAHYLSSIRDGRPDTRTFRIGRGAHKIALEGAPWFGATGLVLWSGKQRRGEQWEKFLAEHPDDEILNRAEWEQVNRIAEAIVNHRSEVGPSAMEVLRGVREKTIAWKVLGRDCSGTPDVRGMLGDVEHVAELKTCESSAPERFQHAFRRYKYGAQLAWYLDGVLASGLGKPRHAYIVAVESTRPHPVTVFRLTDNAIDLGRRSCRLWFEQLRVCEDGDHWPAYAQGVVDLDELDADGFAMRVGGKDVVVDDDTDESPAPEPLTDNEAHEALDLF